MKGNNQVELSKLAFVLFVAGYTPEEIVSTFGGKRLGAIAAEANIILREKRVPLNDLVWEWVASFGKDFDGLHTIGDCLESFLEEGVATIERWLLIVECELINRAKRGDQEAFALAVQPYEAVVRGLIAGLVKERGEADSIQQDCLIDSWESVGS